MLQTMRVTAFFSRTSAANISSSMFEQQNVHFPDAHRQSSHRMEVAKMTERMIPGLQFRTDSRQQQAIERESNKFS
jgi:hypothetical protein